LPDAFISSLDIVTISPVTWIVSVALLNDDFGSNFERVGSATQLPTKRFSTGATAWRELACNGVRTTTVAAAANNMPLSIASLLRANGYSWLDTKG
jgi:hypothetical protein